jgi:D-glycero-beta-D-manno-heptose-7-phosphate kinase
MTQLTRQRAREVAQRFAGKRIVVLGDLMLDEFVWGRVRRISPEAPVPVVEVERQTLALGGAGNVASNLVALGASPLPIGIVGDDADGNRLGDALRSLGVDDAGLVVDPGRPTTLKTRIIAHSQQVVRADRESRAKIGRETEERVVRRFGEKLIGADAVVVSDYNKGVLSSAVLRECLGAARERGLIVCLDPKMRAFDAYQPVTVITPNVEEASEASGVPIDDGPSLLRAGRTILESVKCEAVLITRGEEGMTLFTTDGVKHIATVAREVFDVTGAGDTVVGTLALTLASGASFEEAAILANHAAGVVVAKVGTATVSVEELLSTIE